MDLQDLNDTMIQLADTLVVDFDVLDYLDLLLRRATEVMGADAGGVMLTDASGRLQVMASSDEPTRLMELYELQRDAGPCVESHRTGRPVSEPDLGLSERWPAFTAQAVEAGFGAVFAFPLVLRGQGIGALNLLRNEPGAIPEPDMRSAEALAHMAAIGILQHRAVREAQALAQELQTALNSRVVLEQAKGFIAERTGGDMGEAYQRLRWHARHHNLTIRAVATAIITRELAVDDLVAADPG